MKIIIAGAGEVGSHLAKMLSNESNSLTIIDSDENRLNKLREVADVITIWGNPTSIETLKEAGAETADLFIAVSPAHDQDVNIISALLAKKMGSQKVTARINNDEYMHHENKLLFTELGIDLLFYPEKIASYEIVDLLKQTGTTEFMEFARGLLQMVAFRLEEGAPLIDKCVSDITSFSGKSQYKPVAIARDEHTIIPSPQTKFQEGDLVFMICTRDGVPDAMSFSGKKEIPIKNLMIVGGGRIAEMLAKKMSKVSDHIKIIEIKPDRCEYLAETLEKVLVINGDGRNSDLLLEEDVSKTIAEVENIEYIKLAEGMGVDAVINKKLSTAGRIFRFTLSNKVRSIKCLNGSDAEVLEFIVNPNSAITKGPLKELHFPKEAIIGGIIRGNEIFVATDETVIKPYDRVAVFALPQVLSKVNKFFI